MDRSDRPRRPWILGLVIVLITAGVAAALITSEESGTGASDVGDRADAADQSLLATLAIVLGFGHALLTDGALDGPGTAVLLGFGAAAVLAVAGAYVARARRARAGSG